MGLIEIFVKFAVCCNLLFVFCYGKDLVVAVLVLEDGLVWPTNYKQYRCVASLK